MGCPTPVSPRFGGCKKYCTFVGALGEIFPLQDNPKTNCTAEKPFCCWLKTPKCFAKGEDAYKKDCLNGSNEFSAFNIFSEARARASIADEDSPCKDKAESGQKSNKTFMVMPCYTECCRNKECCANKNFKPLCCGGDEMCPIEPEDRKDVGCDGDRGDTF